jgi:hypothetical protein
MARTDDSLDGVISRVDNNLKISEDPDPVTDALRRLVTQYVPLRQSELEIREKLNPIKASARDPQERIGTYIEEHDIKRKHLIFQELTNLFTHNDFLRSQPFKSILFVSSKANLSARKLRAFRPSN